MTSTRRVSRLRRDLVRPLVRRLHPYAPGEQPKARGLIKLNTNENPYPPSPKVLRAIREATDARLRLYPSPTADGLRERLARLHGCAVENLIVGNGSDELLAMAVRGLVEPCPSAGDGDERENGDEATGSARQWVQYFAPSYSLYPVLADLHGARRRPVPLNPDYSLPDPEALRRGGIWSLDAALTLVTTPNAPSGRAYRTADLERLCRGQRGVVLLDEAYVDFADENAMALALKYPHVLVARTFSKAYSLCALRVGYLVGHPDLIGALQKIRDSYNVNGLGQVAAEATLADLPYYRRNFRKVRASRARLATGLEAAGFRVFPSQTNFLLAEPPGRPAAWWSEQLRERRILVRWFASPEVSRYLRISVGTEAETDAVLKAVASMVRKSGGDGRTDGRRMSRRAGDAGRGAGNGQVPRG